MTDTVVPVHTFSVAAYITRQSDGAELVPVDVSTVTYSVWNDVTKEVLADAVSLDPAVVVFASIQPDNRFTQGYNFRWTPPTALLPPENKTYSYLVQLTLTDGSKIPIFYKRKTLAIGAP